MGEYLVFQPQMFNAKAFIFFSAASAEVCRYSVVLYPGVNIFSPLSAHWDGVA